MLYSFTVRRCNLTSFRTLFSIKTMGYGTLLWAQWGYIPIHVSYLKSPACERHTFLCGHASVLDNHEETRTFWDEVEEYEGDQCRDGVQ